MESGEISLNILDLFMKSVESGSFFMIIVFIIQIVIHVIVWSLVIKIFITAFKRYKVHNNFKNNVVLNKEYKKEYKDINKSKLSMFNTDDLQGLKDSFYDRFIQFELAYNNLDYNSMKKLTTSQLYHNYYTGISLDLKSGKKRIIKDIERKNVILYEIDSTIAKQIATLMIEINYVNYTLDKKGNIVSGKDEKVTEKFEVTFRKDFDQNDVIICKNCGVETVGNICEYCRTPVRDEEFKISSIKKIID